MIYESVPTEDILTQQAKYEKIGPYGVQIAYAIALGIAGVLVVIMFLLHTYFQQRGSETMRQLRPLKPMSSNIPITCSTSSTLTVEHGPGEQKVWDPEKAGSQIRGLDVLSSF